MTNHWQTIFDSFYTRFVLRDFFGKIVPGGILLFAVAVSATSLSRVATYAASMSFWAWIAALGVSWLTAFGIQSFAERPLLRRHRLRFIRYYPKVLFTMGNSRLAETLGQKSIPEKVRKAFTDNALTLTENAEVAVTKADSEWQITDEGREFGKEFIVRKEGEKLNVYCPEAERNELPDTSLPGARPQRKAPAHGGRYTAIFITPLRS